MIKKISMNCQYATFPSPLIGKRIFLNSYGLKETEYLNGAICNEFSTR